MADEEKRTPLHWAAGMGHAEVATMLLKEGASLEAADSKGNTPLMYAGEGRRPASRTAPGGSAAWGVCRVPRAAVPATGGHLCLRGGDWLTDLARAAACRQPATGALRW